MALSPNLKLTLDGTLTTTARANLLKIDSLGALLKPENTGTVLIRSLRDIVLRPNSDDLGGSGVVAWGTDAASAKFAATWATADGLTKTVTHNLGTKDVIVQIYDMTDDATILVDSVVRTSTNVITLTASEAPGASSWRVVVIA